MKLLWLCPRLLIESVATVCVPHSMYVAKNVEYSVCFVFPPSVGMLGQEVT